MTGAIQTKYRATDFRAHHRATCRILREAVSDHGIAYRVIDGQHVRLYCGDRDVVPFKISAKSVEHEQVENLLAWLEENVPSWSGREGEITEADLAALAQTVNTSRKPSATERTTVVRRRRSTEEQAKVDDLLDQHEDEIVQAIVQSGLDTGEIKDIAVVMDNGGRGLGLPPKVHSIEVIPKRPKPGPSKATQRAMAVDSVSTRLHEVKDPPSAPPETWVPFHSAKGGQSYGFETNGDVYRCTAPGCGHEQDAPQGLHLHARTHLQAEPEKAPQEVVQRPLEDIQAELREEQLHTHLTAAVQVLAEHYGVGADVSKLEAELDQAQRNHEAAELDVIRLTSELADMTKQRDDLQAKLDLIKEGLGL